MREVSILTKDGILDISMGFKKQYSLQILRLDFQKESVHLTLSDGRVIIGGIYMLPKDFRKNVLFHVFDVIKVSCEFKGEHEPILIKDFVLAQQGFTEALGTSFESLAQYKRLCFLAPKKNTDEVFTQSESKKKSKLNEASCSYQQATNLEINNSLTQKNTLENGVTPFYSQKTQIQEKNYDPVLQKHTNLFKNEQKIFLREKKKNTALKSQSSMTNLQKVQKYHKMIDLQNDKAESQTSCPVPQNQNNQQQSFTVLKSNNHSLISGLYEGISFFKIVCRVNHLSKEQNGKKEPQLRLILRDERGNEMVAILKETLYQGLISDTKHSMPNIIVGKTYSFIGGQVYKTKDQRLVANISWQNVKKQCLFISQFDESKVMTVGECINIQSSRTFLKEIDLCQPSKQSIIVPLKEKDISVFGIFGDFKYNVPRYISSSLFSIQGYLLDPTSKKKIQFSLSTTEKKFYQRGTFILLHNMRIKKEENCIKLFSSSLSYCSEQTNNIFFKRFVTINWEFEEYENISEPLYVYRSIKEVQKISEKSEFMDTFYSEIQYINVDLGVFLKSQVRNINTMPVQIVILESNTILKGSVIV